VAGGIWERERYSWDAAAHTVAVETLDSNTWGPGSRRDYRLTPGSAGGTTIDVTVVRNCKGWKGRLIGVALALAGARMLRSQMERALTRARLNSSAERCALYDRRPKAALPPFPAPSG
jgi:hypothetical protein